MITPRRSMLVDCARNSSSGFCSDKAIKSQLNEEQQVQKITQKSPMVAIVPLSAIGQPKSQPTFNVLKGSIEEVISKRQKFGKEIIFGKSDKI